MISDEEYKKTLKQFHKLSDRHILAAETDMSSSDIQKVVKLSDCLLYTSPSPRD